MQRLPAIVRMVLASADPATEIDKLAEMADKIMEVTAPTIAHISDSCPKSLPPPSSEIQQLQDEVARLTTLVQSLTG